MSPVVLIPRAETELLGRGLSAQTVLVQEDNEARQVNWAFRNLDWVDDVDG